MNKYDYLNSNVTDLNLPHQRTWIRVEDILLAVGNIVYCPYRSTSTQILKIESNNDVTIQFYAQGDPIYRFDADCLLLEFSNPYQIFRQLY